MRKVILPLLLLVMVASAAQAQKPQFGFGVFGGLNFPIAMEDQSQGTVFGAKATVKLIPMLVLEPNIMFSKYGEPDADLYLGSPPSGSKVTAYGLDATFGVMPAGPGFKFYLILGAGIYKVENEDTPYDESKLGYCGGLGFGIGIMPMLDIDLRGKAFIAPQEGSSKKGLLVMAGVTYNLGM
jgi:hypothetical protein